MSKDRESMITVNWICISHIFRVTNFTARRLKCNLQAMINQLQSSEVLRLLIVPLQSISINKCLKLQFWLARLFEIQFQKRFAMSFLRGRLQRGQQKESSWGGNWKFNCCQILWFLKNPLRQSNQSWCYRICAVLKRR